MDQFIWAFETVLSRHLEIKIEDEKIMLAVIPMVDMFNHVQKTENSVESWSYKPKTKTLEVYAPTDYQTGEEVLINYGQKSNVHWLLNHGFLVRSNPQDEVELRMTLDPSTPHYEVKMALMEQFNIDVLKFKYDEVAPQVLVAWRIMAIDDGDLFEDDEKVEKLITMQSIGIDYDYLAMALGVNTLEGVLQAYPTSLDADYMMLESKTAHSINTKNALLFRTQEKEIFQSILNQVLMIIEKIKPRISPQLREQLQQVVL